MGPEHSQDAVGSFSMANDASLNAQYTGFLDTDCAGRRATLATIDSCISPTTKLHAVPSTEFSSMDSDMMPTTTSYTVAAQDNMSQAYNTPQSYQTYTTTPQQVDTTPEPSQPQHMLPTWSPAPSSAAEPDMYALSASATVSNGNLVAFAGEPTTAAPTYPWYSTQDVNDLQARTQSQQSHLSQHSLPSSAQQQQSMQPQPQLAHPPFFSPEYNTQLSNTAMPVLVPYASSTGNRGGYTKAAAMTAAPGGASLYSSSSGYLPIIHVSSSRRRRKALQKGVKKIVQPLKGRRQASV